MNYELRIKTADEYKAGTDSNIFIILEGEKGRTTEVRLNGHFSGNAFERNDTDVATIDFDKDVGRVFRISLRSDMMYAGAGWRVSYIEIQRKGSDDNGISNTSSRFDINEWIENKSDHTYSVSYDDWSKNIVSYQTVSKEYKVYKVTVPKNGTFEYNQTETTTTGFKYSSATTKSSTKEFNESLKLNSSYEQNKKNADKLNDIANYSGYLEFAFKQGFSSSEVTELVSSEEKKISKTATATLKNDTNQDKTYEAVFTLNTINAIASTGAVVAMFSGNSSIDFSGFREAKA